MKAIAPKAPKLTTMEKRAAAMCAEIRQAIRNPGEVYPITIDWAKSASWGLCPRIEFRREKVAHASGCGYCKKSTVLAGALCHLADTEEQRHHIARAGGCGEGEVIRRLAAIGWDLVHIASGKTWDCYNLTRKA